MPFFISLIWCAGGFNVGLGFSIYLFYGIIKTDSLGFFLYLLAKNRTFTF